MRISLLRISLLRFFKTITKIAFDFDFHAFNFDYINHSTTYLLPLICQYFLKYICTVEDAGVDRTVINCHSNQLGQMADFLPLLTP